MNKINKIKFILLSGVLLTGLAGCSHSLTYTYKQEESVEPKVETVKENEKVENVEVGKAKFSIFVPDYEALAEQTSARVIASQTQKIKFSYYNTSGSTAAWVLHTTVDLSTLDKTYIEGSGNTIPGKIYNVQFDNIPSGNYAAGNLKIELVDSTGRVLTSGTNSSTVGILMGETTSATFYTLPVSVTNDVAGLIAGEMKFYKWNVAAGKTYTINVSVSESDTSYPDIVIFDKSGRYVSYHSISAESASVTFDEETENTYRYVGVYAKGNKSIECYTLTFTSTGNISGAVDPAEFNAAGFGSNGTLDSSFTASTTVTASSSWASESRPKLNSSGQVEFYFRYLQTKTSSLKRSIIVNEDSVINFTYQTDITAQYDGYLNFYIDGDLKGSYTGKEGSWTSVSYFVGEGQHELEWRAVGADNSYTSSISNKVLLNSISLTAAPEPDYTLEHGFGIGSSFTYDWTLSGDVKPTLETASGISGKAASFYYKELGTGTSSLSRTVRVTQDSLITFKYKTDIYAQYDGVMNFYIDGVLQESGWTGLGGSWTNAQFLLETGSHIVEWRAVGASSSYTNSNMSWTVLLGDLTIVNAPAAPATLTQDFSSQLDSNLWIGSGVSYGVSTDGNYASWAQYGDALVDIHSEVYKLATRNYDTSNNGNSSLKIFSVKPTVDSALTFDYKLDLYTSDYLRVYVDNVKKFEQTGSGQTWRTASITIPAGKHSILFSVEKDSNTYATTMGNLVYLDNISLVADTTESVDVSPKGKQETYVSGFDIQFTADALRSDGSARSDRTVTWSSTGGTIDANGKFTPGTTAGTYTVTATIDGKTASNTTVIVHGADYLEDSVTINGETFTGYTGTTGTKSTGTVSFSKAPTASSFSADGFFVLKGTVNNSNTSNYAMVQITSGDYQTFVLLKDDFYTRVWLRFGTGTYTVKISDMTSISFSGDDYTGCGLSGSNTITYTVTNTHSLANAVELMPSYYCQSDDFIVSNVVNNILASLPDNATLGQKLQALHDWQIHLLHYDNVSLNTYRKKQDAVTVINNAMAVCEGYANLYAALVRHIGVRTKYQGSSSMNHGWVQCYYNGAWKLVDATWDDPVSSQSNNNVEKNPYAENYKYFLIGLTGVNNDHHDDTTNTNRSAASDYNSNYRLIGLPGWY